MDLAAVVNPSLVVRKLTNAPGASRLGSRAAVNASVRGVGDVPGLVAAAAGNAQVPKRLAVVTVAFRCEVDHAVATDLPALWEGTLRPYVLAQAQAQAGIGAYALVRENPAFDPVAHQVTADLELHALDGSNVIEMTVETTTEEQTGAVLVPVWDAGGLEHALFQGPVRRYTSRTVRAVAAAGQGKVPELVVPGAVRLDRRASRREFTLGLPGYELDLEEVSAQERWQHYTPYTGGGGDDRRSIVGVPGFVGFVDFGI